MSVRLAIVILLCYESIQIESAIIGSPRNHHVNSIAGENKLAKNTSHPEIPTDVNIERNPPSSGRNTLIHQKQTTKTKVTIPPIQNKISLIPHNILPQKSNEPNLLGHKRLDHLLKQEVPKLPNKLHHFSFDDLLQKRKEMKEKWQARHNKFWQKTQEDLLDRKYEHLKSTENHAEKLHIGGKHALGLKSSLKPTTKKETMKQTDSENLKHLGVSYEQVTPRTRRILEHKEEPLPYQRTKPLFSAKFIARSNLPTLSQISDVTGSFRPEVKTENYAEISSSPWEPKATSVAKPTTEGHFNAANYVYEYPPYIPMMPEMYWPRDLSTTLAPKISGSIQPEVTTENLAKISKSTEETKSASSGKLTTAGHFNLANYVYEYPPYIPMMPEMYWPRDLSTTHVPKVSEFIQPEVKTENSAKISITSEEPKDADAAKHTTEAYFNVANYVYEYPPYIPMMPEMYWPKETSSELSKSTPSNHRQVSPKLTPSSSPIPPIVGQVRFLSNDHTPESQNSNTASTKIDSTTATNTNEMDIDKGTKLTENPVQKSKHDTRLRFVPEKTPTESPPPVLDDVVSVKIDTSRMSDDATNKISNPPFTWNPAEQEKLLHQNPNLNHRKSEERVRNAINVLQLEEQVDDVLKNPATKSAHDKELPTKNVSAKSAAAGEETQESAGNKTKISWENDEELNKTVSPSQGNSMKISTETQVNQDWREHLRKAVKERLQKLRRDSVDN